MKNLVFIAVTGFAALMFVAPAVSGVELSGIPKVIDGETIEVGTRRFRLYGIDAPDSRQTCEIRGRIYDCGHISKTALMDLVAGVQIRCVLRATTVSAPGTRQATCYAGGYDLAEGMVHTGWALAMPRDGGKYLRIERRAEQAGRGLWQGKFTRPWDWKPN